MRRAYFCSGMTGSIVSLQVFDGDPLFVSHSLMSRRLDRAEERKKGKR
jgi:hypothetical protein